MDGSNLATELEPRRRRRSLRRTVRLETEVTSELWDGVISLLATDISMHGMWLEADFPLGIGSELAISFIPPDCPHGIPLHVRGRIVRVSLLRRRTDSGNAGMGVSFHELRAEQIQRLTRALHGMPPPLLRRIDTAEHAPTRSPITAIFRTRRALQYFY